MGFTVKGLNEAIGKVQSFRENLEDVALSAMVEVAKDLKNVLENAEPRYKDKIDIIVRKDENRVWLGPDLEFAPLVEYGSPTRYVIYGCSEWKYEQERVRPEVEGNFLLDQLADAVETEHMFVSLISKRIKEYLGGL